MNDTLNYSYALRLRKSTKVRYTIDDADLTVTRPNTPSPPLRSADAEKSSAPIRRHRRCTTPASTSLLLNVVFVCFAFWKKLCAAVIKVG